MTSTNTASAGNRRALPEDALRRCAECGTPRGNVRRGWEPITRDGAVVGYTCPDCPTSREPIRRDGDRFYAVVGIREDGKRRQLTRRHDTLDAARAWVAEVRAGAATARRRAAAYTDPSRFTVGQICERWLDRRASEVGTPGGIREGTLNAYRSALHSLLILLGDRVARDLSEDDIEAALRTLARDGGARLGRGLSHRSITYALSTLRQVLSHAQRQGWLSANVAQLARAPRKHGDVDGGSRRARRWSVAQMRQFRDHLDLAFTDAERLAADPWVPVAMRLALCGLRRSEVLGLDWANVDLVAGAVTVAASRVSVGRGSGTSLGATKTANSRRVVAAETIHTGTLEALRALHSAQGEPGEGLVVLDAVGQPVHPDTFSHRFRKLCAEAGVPFPGSIHNTRHTLATALQEAGLPDVHGAALLGHDVATYRSFYVVTDDDSALIGAEAAGQLFSAL